MQTDVVKGPASFLRPSLAKDSGEQGQILAFSAYVGGRGATIGRCSFCVVMNAFQSLSTEFSTADDILDHSLLLPLLFLWLFDTMPNRFSPPSLAIPSQGHLQSPLPFSFL